MARRKNTLEEESGATAVLDAPVADESGASAPVTSAKQTGRLVKYWSPENGSLIIGSDPTVKFIEHLVVIDPEKSPATHKALQSSNAFKVAFFVVEDKEGDDDFKIAFGRRLRALVGNDPSDMVSRERGFISICALFSPDEITKFGISKSQPDIEKVIYCAVNNKYVEGIV